MNLALILCLCLAAPAQAAFLTLGQAQPQRFDQAAHAWRSLPVLVEFDAQAEAARVRLPKLPWDQPLYARLDLKTLPHYSQWVAHRRQQGGAMWTALKAVLDEVGEGPIVAMTHNDLKGPGPATVLLGLRQGSRFKLYASVPGQLQRCGHELCFEPGEPVFASTTSAMAWKLFKPWALSQLKGH